MNIVVDRLDERLVSVIKRYEDCFITKLGLQTAQKISFVDSTNKAIANLLLTHLLKVESISPGAAELMFDCLLKNESLDVKEGAKLDRINLKKIVSTYVDDSLEDVVYEALELAGLSGKVVLMKQQSQLTKDTLEFNSGSFFPNVTSIFKLKNSKFLNPKIVCIDGFVESVSEMHRLLEDASRLKDIVFLFLRGVSEEVVHTLKVNYDRGTLSVIPFIVNYDLEGVNLLNDIAVVSASDVVSSLKGQLISNIDLSTYPRVDYINISDSGVLIEKRETNSNVDHHISILQKKLLEVDSDAAKDMIAKRIKNLGSNRVTISLRSDQDILKRSFMVDRALRATKLASTHGVGEYKNKLYPLTTLKIAKHYCDSFLKEYKNLGAILS